MTESLEDWHESESEWEVDPVEVDRARRQGLVFRLIDCREEDEYRLCHLDGSELVPSRTFAHRVDLDVAGGEPWVIYCHHGMRSLQAVRYLRARGRRRVYSMRGGIDAWSRTVDPNIPTY